MTPEEKKAWAEDLLSSKCKELGRLPKKKDFDSATCAQIKYQLKDGDVVQWRYTCDLGEDVGGGYTVGG